MLSLVVLPHQISTFSFLAKMPALTPLLISILFAVDSILLSKQFRGVLELFYSENVLRKAIFQGCLELLLKLRVFVCKIVILISDIPGKCVKKLICKSQFLFILEQFLVLLTFSHFSYDLNHSIGQNLL